MASLTAFNMLALSLMAALIVLFSAPEVNAQGSVHLTTDPPITRAVTNVFPSWLDAFETVKREPTEPPERDIPPMVVPEPRRTTWYHYKQKLSTQLWRMLNYVHQVNQLPMNEHPLVAFQAQFGWTPSAPFIYMDGEEWESYRRLNPLPEGARDVENEYRLKLQKEEKEEADKDYQKVMKWVETGEEAPQPPGSAPDILDSTQAPAAKSALRGAGSNVAVAEVDAEAEQEKASIE